MRCWRLSLNHIEMHRFRHMETDGDGLTPTSPHVHPRAEHAAVWRRGIAVQHQPLRTATVAFVMPQENGVLLLVEELSCKARVSRRLAASSRGAGQ